MQRSKKRSCKHIKKQEASYVLIHSKQTKSFFLFRKWSKEIVGGIKSTRRNQVVCMTPFQVEYLIYLGFLPANQEYLYIKVFILDSK